MTCAQLATEGVKKCMSHPPNLTIEHASVDRSAFTTWASYDWSHSNPYSDSNNLDVADLDSAGFSFEVSGFGSGFGILRFAHH